MAELLHTKADETADWWMDQIESAQALARDVARDHFRPELKNALDLQIGDIVVGSEEDHVEQVDLNFVESHCTYIESVTFDQYPQVKVDRQVMPDKETGEMQEQLYARVGHESREMDEWKAAIKDLYAGGGFCIWYGTHENATDAMMLLNASRTPDQVVAHVMQDFKEGKQTYRTFPGQDHAGIITVLQNQALDPEIADGVNGREIQQALIFVQAMHEKQKEKDDKSPRDSRFERSEIWCQRSDVGLKTVWEQKPDHRDIRWLARCVTMDVDVGRNSEAFKPSIRSLIVPMKRPSVDGWPGEPIDEGDAGWSKDSGSSWVKTNDFYYWELWDIKYQEKRYILPGLNGNQFLERDSSYPHYDRNGEPIKGFFPCVLHFPDKVNKQSPRRAFAKPLGAKGWPWMRLAIKLATANYNIVNKISVRHIEVNETVDEDTMQAMQSGKNGVLIKRPAGMSDMPGSRMAVPIDYGSVPPEVFQQVLWAKNEFRETMTWPVHQASGQVQGVTATEVDAAMSGGAIAVGAIGRGLQHAFSRGQEIKRHLIRAHYTEPEVSGLIGPTWTARRNDAGEMDPKGNNPSVWERWLDSSLEGDVLKTKFQSSVESENAVIRDQAANVFDRLVAMPGPAPGLPMFRQQDLAPFIEKFVTMHGFDMPKIAEYDQREIEAAMLAAAIAEAGPQKASSSKSPSRNGKKRAAKTFKDVNQRAQNTNPRS